MFQFPRFLVPTYGFSRPYLGITPWGFPIRTSPDQRLLTAPRGFSQPATSFIGSWRQGIHRAPLVAQRRTPHARRQADRIGSVPRIIDGFDCSTPSDLFRCHHSSVVKVLARAPTDSLRNTNPAWLLPDRSPHSTTAPWSGTAMFSVSEPRRQWMLPCRFVRGNSSLYPIPQHAATCSLAADRGFWGGRAWSRTRDLSLIRTAL